MRGVVAFASALALSACASLAGDTGAGQHPFVGCWDSADGQSREGWTIDPSGWLVGYSANRSADNQVTFFEFLRIERGNGPDVLVVTGADGATTRFAREDVGDTGVHRFINPAHDYPQAITYRSSAGRLDADISLLDGSNARSFLKAACR